MDIHARDGAARDAVGINARDAAARDAVACPTDTRDVEAGDAVSDARDARIHCLLRQHLQLQLLSPVLLQVVSLALAGSNLKQILRLVFAFPQPSHPRV